MRTILLGQLAKNPQNYQHLVGRWCVVYYDTGHRTINGPSELEPAKKVVKITKVTDKGFHYEIPGKILVSGGFLTERPNYGGANYGDPRVTANARLCLANPRDIPK